MTPGSRALRRYFCEAQRMLDNFWYHSRNLIELSAKPKPNQIHLHYQMRGLKLHHVVQRPAGSSYPFQSEIE